jgi:hypothetical protein
MLPDSSLVVQEVPSLEDWVDRLLLCISPRAATHGFSVFKFIMATTKYWHGVGWRVSMTPLVYYFLY